ncbi:MAG: hypothetical protein M3Q52_03335 [Pseudomonadota bacterium]|nr:hypothetical protein [Pseudomonadota bacterium]
MRIIVAVPLLLLAACGQSQEDQLEAAANQSDPAAAAVLENAADNGMNPQQALEAAGQAQVQGNVSTQTQSVQARPNLPQSPNRPEDGAPPEKVAVPTGAAPANQQ